MGSPADFVVHAGVVAGSVLGMLSVATTDALLVGAIAAVGIEAYWLVIRND